MIVMWRSAIWATALTSAGCAQLFGIKETTGGDAGAGGATLEVTRRSIGATLMTGPQDLTGQTASFYFPDAPSTKVDGTPSGNTWSAPGNGNPTIIYTLPDYPQPLIHGLALPSRAVKLGYDVFEHPSPTAAATGAMVTAQATLPSPFAAGESLEFLAIGAWSQYAITTGLPAVGTTAVNTTFPYSSSTSLTGRPLEKFTAADRVLLLRYVGANLTGAAEASVDQSDTTTTVVFGPVAAVGATTTGTIPIDSTTLSNRYLGSLPAMTYAGTSWAVVAAVTPGTSSGPRLSTGSVAMTDTSISLAYDNPFTSPAWNTEVFIASSATRMYAPGAPTLPVTLSASLFELADPSATFDFPAGMPTSIAVNNTTLMSDGMTVTIDRTTAVTVSFAADMSNNALYQIQLFALMPDSTNTSLVYQDVFDLTSTQPMFSVPPELFPPGTYTLRATCIAGGYPGAQAGDVTMRALPMSLGSLDSGVFTVVN